MMALSSAHATTRRGMAVPDRPDAEVGPGEVEEQILESGGRRSRFHLLKKVKFP